MEKWRLLIELIVALATGAMVAEIAVPAIGALLKRKGKNLSNKVKIVLWLMCLGIPAALARLKTFNLAAVLVLILLIGAFIASDAKNKIMIVRIQRLLGIPVTALIVSHIIFDSIASWNNGKNLLFLLVPVGFYLILAFMYREKKEKKEKKKELNLDFVPQLILTCFIAALIVGVSIFIIKTKGVI
ncbi:MAG: hypothetical protein Q4A25_01850 [Candidatus Saccharibacteria bacterium]|nr:hypothetical protein [Candidatus Saccharibacteria bacterium]